MASRTDGVIKQLDRLRTISPDIEVAAVVSIEGLIIARSMAEELEDERLGAMSAAMLALGERIADELGRGPLDQVTIKGEEGYAVLMTVDESSVLCVLAADEAKLGLVYLDMWRTVSDLRELN
ncbi:MAG: roadblock/LC7 domain-containing protein [Chloroflexi bacterium]|nr:roadblock/LC7 domain-containing protein [Chloroflexota bacterium]